MREIHDNSPDEWLEIVEFDKQARQLPKMKAKTYLNRQLVPMDEMNLTMQSDLMGGLFDCDGDTCGI